ncbi:MAG: class I SAM-dependent methyltransferase [bacterium]|nr:class I SAM-dependent methyltransferase [bacterium]
MLKQWYYDLMTEVHRKRGLAQLRRLERQHATREERISVPFVYRGIGHFKKIQPRQNRTEIEGLYNEVCALAPKRVLEVGTARGGTLYLWTQAARDDAIIVSVDLPGGEFGGAYPPCRVPFYRLFARASQDLHLLRADSHDPATLGEVRDLFASEPIDFAFIDGDHTYVGVKSDFETYGPLVRPGGLIAFHDILPRSDEPEIQVDRFWKEVRDQYDCHEFIGDDSGGRRIGIGVIQVGEKRVGE